MNILENPYHDGRTEPKMHYVGERGYMELLSDLYHFGCDTPDRTGAGRRKMFGATMRFDLRKGFPFPTVRPTPLRIAQLEFWGFLNGRVDIHNYLSEHGINIWKGNTTREFLDNRGLHNLPVGHMGKAYGFQYRNFNGTYDENFAPEGGKDQIKALFDELKSNAFSSRTIASIWNPVQESEMALPPCWWNHQFVVTLDRKGQKVLNLHAHARSADVLFGSPFNIQQFAIYLVAMAKAQGMIAGELFCTLVDAHIYGEISDLNNATVDNNAASQIKYVAETLEREIYEEPVHIEITKDIQTFEDFLSLSMDDIQIGDNYKINRKEYVEPRPEMAV